MFSGKGAPKIRSRPTEEHPRRSAISIKPLRNSIEIIPRQGRPPQVHCILSKQPPPPFPPPHQQHLWMAASEEREKYRKVYIKSLYKKVYIKYYKNLFRMKHCLYIHQDYQPQKLSRYPLDEISCE